MMASMPYAKENVASSWYYVLSTICFLLLAFAATFNSYHWGLRLAAGILTGLLMVRFFILYHDYNHFAILRNSLIGKILMTTFGIFILAPITIWKRTHDHHHHHNSKLRITGIGSYPTISKRQFLKLSKNHKLLYLINRHPLTIFFGYFTLFIYWLR